LNVQELGGRVQELKVGVESSVQFEKVEKF